MSIKNKVLEEINAKILKKKQLNSKREGINSAVFEFFRQAEEAKTIGGGSRYEPEIFARALDTLIIKIRRHDLLASVTPAWSDNYTSIRGVNIFWSNRFASENSISQEEYIDIGEMLFA